MYHRSFYIGFAAVLTLLSWMPLARAQQDAGYKPVEAKYLQSNLPKFWATGLAFVDTVADPLSSESQRLGNKTYVKFRTKVVGECYADSSLGALLQQLQPGKDFVFTATVLQRERGLFSFGGPPQYVVAVMNMQPALGNASSIPDQLGTFALPTNSPDAQLLANLGTLMKGLQTDLALLARERGVQPWELLDPASTNRLAAEILITSGVNSLASEMKVQPQDILGQVLMALVAARVQPEAATPAPPAAPAPKPAVETVPNVEKAASDDAAREAQAASDKLKAAQEKKARLEAERLAEQEKERLEAEQAQLAKKAKAEKIQQAREQAEKEKAARLESERLAAEKAAQEKKAAEEKIRVEKEKADAEKQALAAQAKAEKARLEQEKKLQAEKAEALAAEERARQETERKAKEAAEAAAKAEKPQPKLRASSTVEAVRLEPAPAPIRPSAKLSPPPVPTTPKAPEPVSPPPADDDLNAPVPR